MNIVYLYTEIMPYVDVVFNELSNQGHTITAFYKDKALQTPYVPRVIRNVEYCKESEFNTENLLDYINGKKPDIIVIAGWSYNKYLKIAKTYFNVVPTICPIDTQYLGTIKQIIGVLFSFFFVRRYFSHIWVPGVRQFHFARLLGYKPSRIIMNSLTGDVSLFNTVDLTRKKDNYPKTFLFVGRYHQAKGLDILIKAWSNIVDKKGWKLVTVGNGPLESVLQSSPDIEVLGFKSQDDLIAIAASSGVFILPSMYEPWALVLHEFSAAGLPIICSDACGASSHFVISGYNGYTFETGSISDLQNKMEKIMSMKSEELLIMSQRSKSLSLYTNPEFSAYSLLSVLE